MRAKRTGEATDAPGTNYRQHRLLRQQHANGNDRSYTPRGEADEHLSKQNAADVGIEFVREHI